MTIVSYIIDDEQKVLDAYMIFLSENEDIVTKNLLFFSLAALFDDEKEKSNFDETGKKVVSVILVCKKISNPPN